MNGPEHYREAERLLTVCAGPERGSELDRICTEAAQVHATLALAAATALGGITLTLPEGSDYAVEWNSAIGVTL